MTDELLELVRCTFEEMNQDSQNSPLFLIVIRTGQLSFKSGGEKTSRKCPSGVTSAKITAVKRNRAMQNTLKGTLSSDSYFKMLNFPELCILHFFKVTERKMFVKIS